MTSERAKRPRLTRHHADFVVHGGFRPEEHPQLLRDRAQSPPVDQWVEDQLVTPCKESVGGLSGS